MSIRRTLESQLRGVKPQSEQQPANTSPQLGRRSFLKRVGLGGVALLPAALLPEHASADHGNDNGSLSDGDTAILRFLAAAEILETDLWQQYNELALGNLPFQQGLFALDGDIPTYVNQNTRDEFSHQDFINAYLKSKGQLPVNLERFRTLPSSQATGANKTAKRLTNLMNLTVDTSWYTRYRSTGNPDFGDSFAQIVNLVNLPAIPNADLPVGGDDAQVIAKTAGFHFATIEQGGTSLYASFLPKATVKRSSESLLALAAAKSSTSKSGRTKPATRHPSPSPPARASRPFRLLRTSYPTGLIHLIQLTQIKSCPGRVNSAQTSRSAR